MKRKLVSDAARFERDKQSKRRRLENKLRLDATHSLLELCDIGNGSTYCEPYSGVSCNTDLTMSNINCLEGEVVALRKKSEQHEIAYSSLMDECKLLKEKLSNVEKELSDLKRTPV